MRIFAAEMMKKIVLTVALFALFANGVSAQVRNLSARELGVAAGVLVPMDPDFSGEITLGLTYHKFYSNGLGIRTGLQYTPYTAKLDHTFGVPLALAYRWNKKEGNLPEDGFRGARRSVETGGGLGSALAGFLLNLNRGTEFYFGLTPGYVASSKSGLHVSTDRQFRTERYTENGSPFFLSLDGGMAFNYPVGRVNLSLSPAFHYVLTDTYRVHTLTIDTVSGQTESKDRSIRWLLSLCGGISIAF